MATPFDPATLVARVAIVHRRVATRPHGSSTFLRYPGTELDLVQRRAVVDGAEVSVTRTEWALLEVLAQRSGHAVLPGKLLEEVWGREVRDEAGYLEVWISRLATKLASSGASFLITSIPGRGYSLASPGRDTANGAGE